MRKNGEYLLTLDAAAVGVVKEGSDARVYDWADGNAFDVYLQSMTKSGQFAAAHVVALAENRYDDANKGQSRLRYRIEDGLESREIMHVTTLRE